MLWMLTMIVETLKDLKRKKIHQNVERKIITISPSFALFNIIFNCVLLNHLHLSPYFVICTFCWIDVVSNKICFEYFKISFLFFFVYIWLRRSEITNFTQCNISLSCIYFFSESRSHLKERHILTIRKKCSSHND